jgi:hypothetical protein
VPEYPEGFEPEQGGLHSFFGQLVDEGLSQRGAIDAFREAGGRGSNEVLRDAYNFARDTAEDRPIGWGQPVDQPWDPGAFVEWEAGRPGLAGYPVNIHLRTVDGEDVVIPHFVYGDDSMSPEDVFGQAIDTYGEGMSDTDTAVRGDITSVSMRGAPYLMVGRPAA